MEFNAASEHSVFGEVLILGYSVHYGLDGKAERTWKNRVKKRKYQGWVAVILVVLIGVGAMSTREETLEKLLIPGDPEVTKGAYIQFTEDLQEGDSFREAITTFCQEIFAGANLE